MKDWNGATNLELLAVLGNTLAAVDEISTTTPVPSNETLCNV